ncbi:epoxyqueuosine reductase [bacterium]|nr:MAG: epoxyqueuosine reductase [bacterium]
MPKVENRNKLKKFCLNWGADVFGVADISGMKDSFALPDTVSRGLSSAVCVGARVASPVLEGIEQEPTKLYFHHYRTVNMFLDQLTLRAANFIQNLGFRALPIPASQIVDWQKQTAHLSHKHVAYQAGLGWIGRNNLLVNKKLGSQFRLSTVLTDLPLKADKPAREDCGKCFACVVKCPVKAIKEKPGDFNHLGCFELLKEFQRNKIADQYICGICVRACRGRS